MGQFPNLQFLFRHISSLNPNSPSSVRIVKEYVMLIEIHPWDGTVNLTVLILIFDKRRLMPEPGFSSTLPHRH